MSTMRHRAAAALFGMTLLLGAPDIARAQDKDVVEVQRYMLSEAALAKYTAATKSLAALPSAGCTEDDSDSENPSIDHMVAKLGAVPGAQAAVQSAGMSLREYVVFSMSLFQNGLAAWAVDQPGGKLPPAVSKANVEFVKKHGAELKQLEGLRPDGGCDGGDAGEDAAD
jgi:hypothetical protein